MSIFSDSTSYFSGCAHLTISYAGPALALDFKRPDSMLPKQSLEDSASAELEVEQAWTWSQKPGFNCYARNVTS